MTRTAPPEAADRCEAPSSVSVFIAPPSQRPILAALADLSSAGVLAPFHWAEVVPGTGAGASGDPVLVTVREGAATLSRFSQAVRRHGLSTVRLIVVVPVGHPAKDALSAQDELEFHGLGIMSTAVRECTRVLVPWSDEPLPAELGRQSWHNVMLSPESTGDPAYSPTPWWTDPQGIPAAAAVGLAVQGGLCGAVSSTPHQGRANTSSTFVEVTRSFVRITDAHAAEDELRRRVLNLQGRFPRPTRAETGVWLTPYPDPAGRVAAAAQAWLTRHARALRRPMAPVAQREAEEIGFLQAIGMFFSFMVKAIAGAPGAWLRDQLHSAKAGVAAATSALIFGEGSPVRVVVGGVDSSGTSAGWRDLTSAAKRASAILPQELPGSKPSARRDFSALWQDLVFGARALVDGSGCAELDLATYEGFVEQRDLIAPPLDGDGSFTIPETIGTIGAGTTVHAWDRLEIDRIGSELKMVAEAGEPRSAAAAQLLTRMGRWRADQDQRFIPLIGQHLAKSFTRTRKDVTILSRQLEELARQDPGAQSVAQQRRLARLESLLLIVLLIGLGAAAILGAIKVISWSLVAVLVGAAIVGWLLCAVLVFISRQREVFRLIAIARSRDQQLPTLSANLQLALEDLAAQGEAYAQFDRWASIITSFLTDPLGEHLTERTAREHLTELPAPMQRVIVRADDDSLADTAADLRAMVFTVGWAGAAWESLRERIKEDLTADQRSLLRSRQLELFSEPADQGSALSNWARGLETKGVRSAAGAKHWETCLGLLGAPGGPSLDLKASTAEGWLPVTDYREDLAACRGERVVRQVLGAAARSGREGFTTVEGHWFIESCDGLSQTLVLADSTSPLPESSFIYPRPVTWQYKDLDEDPDGGAPAAMAEGGSPARPTGADDDEIEY